MDADCKNCGAALNGSYCSGCGQPAAIHRINWHYVWHGLEHSLFHVEKGIWFTAKEYFRRPGYAARDFFAGKRVAYLPALTYLAIVMVFFYLMGVLVLPKDLVFENKMAETFSHFITAYYEKLLILIVIPLSAVFTGWLFPRIPYNFYERFIFFCYMRAQFILVELGVLLADWLLVQFNIFLSYYFVYGVVVVSTYVLLTRSMQQLLEGMEYSRIWLRVLAVFVLVVVSAFLLGGIAGAIYYLFNR